MAPGGWGRGGSLFFPSSVPSSHLDPVSTHSTLQGSGATTPEHPSVIDPLMEQDEGPGTPPAKQSTTSSRSANVCYEPSTCAPGPGGVGGSLWPKHILRETWVPPQPVPLCARDSTLGCQDLGWGACQSFFPLSLLPFVSFLTESF